MRPYWMVNYYCASGKIKGAAKISDVWVIPKAPQGPPTGESNRRKIGIMHVVISWELGISLEITKD